MNHLDLHSAAMSFATRYFQSPEEWANKPVREDIEKNETHTSLISTGPEPSPELCTAKELGKMIPAQEKLKVSFPRLPEVWKAPQLLNRLTAEPGQSRQNEIIEQTWKAIREIEEETQKKIDEDEHKRIFKQEILSKPETDIEIITKEEIEEVSVVESSSQGTYEPQREGLKEQQEKTKESSGNVDGARKLPTTAPSKSIAEAEEATEQEDVSGGLTMCTNSQPTFDSSASENEEVVEQTVEDVQENNEPEVSVEEMWKAIQDETRKKQGNRKREEEEQEELEELRRKAEEIENDCEEIRRKRKEKSENWKNELDEMMAESERDLQEFLRMATEFLRRRQWNRQVEENWNRRLNAQRTSFTPALDIFKSFERELTRRNYILQSSPSIPTEKSSLLIEFAFEKFLHALEALFFLSSTGAAFLCDIIAILENSMDKLEEVQRVANSLWEESLLTSHTMMESDVWKLLVEKMAALNEVLRNTPTVESLNEKYRDRH
ncbi:unnamed protein product [Caenorhabditis auriculariae]|uniref:Uncharacterized protein n=1 Tax=Caenorhabditis auriculariae TaxID=2777116 RepID=A0A8S1HG59_9PELO|nr:unnamed protein product [Caenorhabditis auriculariae]